MNCPDGTIDNGDHVIVPKGVTCHLGCLADNGKEFRIDSAQFKYHGKVTCNRPLSKEHLAKYGCNNGECDTDLIANGPNKANWPNNIVPDELGRPTDIWGYSFYGGYKYRSTNIGFDEMFDNEDLMKCYPILNNKCDPADLSSDKDETDVSWDCPSGYGPGAVCKKTCNDGILGGNWNKKTCECKSRCQWKGTVASCKRPVDESCDPNDLPSDENDEFDVSWDCPNGHGPGAVCTKICNNGTMAGGKSEKRCECNLRCQWKGPVASCKRPVCVLAEYRGDAPYWPGSVTCTSADGSIDFGVYDKWTEYPVGTICSAKCTKYQDINYDYGWKSSTCQCSDGRNG